MDGKVVTLPYAMSHHKQEGLSGLARCRKFDGWLAASPPERMSNWRSCSPSAAFVLPVTARHFVAGYTRNYSC